ncbi:tryptophan--tRNA ligase, partial [Octadecabacter sp.]|nr:tryptophan--tRNA ligase [Octadecabacter sp.]
DPAEIDRKLAAGADKARGIAAPILEKTYDIVGLLR